jgi:LPPG:FO 2-phospho-L-lactate transferase
LGVDTWFQLGDADLAMHVARTEALGHGARLSEVTRTLAAALRVRHRIVPMSDDAVRTQLLTDEGWLDFQEYFVHRQCAPRLQSLRFAGCESALPQPDALHALARSDLRAIIICPSNPFVSIGPILALPALRAELESARAPVLAVTPIVGGKAIKGPAAKMLEELGLTVSAESVARYYDGLLDAFVSDESDPPLQGPPEVRMLRAATLMTSVEARSRLARDVLEAADTLT